MQDRIKEHERDIRPPHTQTSAISEHANNTGHKPLWNKVKSIDCDPHWFTHRVKDAILETWISTIKKNNRITVRQRTAEGTTHRNNEDQNAPVAVHKNQPITQEHPA